MQPYKVKWEGDDLKNLLTMSNAQLQSHYYWLDWEGLRRTRNKYRAKARKVIEMERNPEQARTPEADKLSELFERSGIDPNDILKINRVNLYQGYMKNQEGEFETTDLMSVQYIPKPTELTEDMFISQAKPTIIRPTKSTGKKTSHEKLAIVLPDIQAGFRRYEDGTLDPVSYTHLTLPTILRV